jgi:hypothetical protein
VNGDEPTRASRRRPVPHRGEGAGGIGLADRVIGKQIELELGPLRRGSSPVVVGPWVGGHVEEVLYWIPFARRQAARLGLERSRVIGVSHGGMARWYDDFCGDYADLRDLLGTEQLTAALSGLSSDRERAARDALEALGVARQASLPPSAMHRLFDGYRRGRAPLEVVLEFADFAPRALAAPDPGRRPFVVVEAAALGRSDDPVAALVDDLGAEGALRVGESGAEPSRADRWALDAELAAEASLLVGRADGLALVGPLLGVPTVAVQDGAMPPSEPDVDLAAWIAQRLDRAFSIVERGQLELLRTAAIGPQRAMGASTAVSPTRARPSSR